MPYIVESKEYLDFLESKEYLDYLNEIQLFRDKFMGDIYNEFIFINDDKFII